MSDVGDVARAVEVVGKIIYGELHPSQQSQIKESYEKHQSRVDSFARSALAGNMSECVHLWRGVVSHFRVGVSEDDIRKLEGLEIQKLNAYEWLGQFSAAESSEFYREVTQIIKTNEDTSTS